MSPVAPPIPDGLKVTIDTDTRRLDGRTLYGGSPARMIRLSSAGESALNEIYDGLPRSLAARTLARKLIDGGLAHPSPAAKTGPQDVTIVIPAHDRVELLELTLRSLTHRVPVIVVDDGSTRPRDVATVVNRNGARLITRSHSGGPGAARTTGLAEVSTEFVAFLDSDCVPQEDWLPRLLGHFDDPKVGAVAPRVVAAPDASLAGRYSSACGPLDLGKQPARVTPGTRVSYVPTAALIVRRKALEDVLVDGNVFDPALRVGEDVDLVWRLNRAEWRVRFDPSVTVAHTEPGKWSKLLTRRFRYGTSAAPLSIRHPGNLSPLVLHIWPALVVLSLLARRPALAALLFAGQLAALQSRLTAAAIPSENLVRPAATGVFETWRGIGRYGTQFASPAIAAALVLPGTKRQPGRQIALVSLLIGPALASYVETRPKIDPARFSAFRIADDVAYGAGVWLGCIRQRTLAPLIPKIAPILKRNDR